MSDSTTADKLKKADKAWRESLEQLRVMATEAEKLRWEKDQAANRHAEAVQRLQAAREKAQEAVERWGQVMHEEAQDELGRAAAEAVEAMQDPKARGARGCTCPPSPPICLGHDFGCPLNPYSSGKATA